MNMLDVEEFSIQPSVFFYATNWLIDFNSMWNDLGLFYA